MPPESRYLQAISCRLPYQRNVHANMNVIRCHIYDITDETHVVTFWEINNHDIVRDYRGNCGMGRVMNDGETEHDTEFGS